MTIFGDKMKIESKVYRQEKKYLLSMTQAMILEQRIKAILPLDTNSGGGSYHIRSIYFDTIFDKAYEEKVAGINEREKIRIRFYGLNQDVIKLERKEKRENLIYKEHCVIDIKTAESMIRGDFEGLLRYESVLAQYVYGLAKSEGLRAVVIVDYIRRAYLHPIGNLRVTFDSQLMSSIPSENVWEIGKTFDVLGENIILEIKFNQIIPTYIKEILCSVPGIKMAISKYVLCRENMLKKQGNYLGGKIS